MVNFFEAQDQARRRTKWLVVYFIGAIVSIVLVGYLGVFWGLKLAGHRIELWEPGLFGLVSGVTLILILGGTAYKSAQLRQGGRAVAESLGGRPVLPDTGDFRERQLLNVVEEMAIASGTPVPLVYLMDEESGINAFAAGTDPSNAVIGVTRGCLELLSRSELQGVVAHEFSHIRNGDMRLNMRLIGFIYGILILMIVGRILLHSMRYTRVGKRDSGGSAMLVVLLIGLVFFLVGAVGGFFARLIQAAVSRQREFLADASAVQFTRDTGGLTGALRKIGGWQDRSRMRNPQCSAVSHIFFAEGSLFRWGLATHPPLRERIHALQPTSSDIYFDSVSLPDVELAGQGRGNLAAVSQFAPAPESGSPREDYNKEWLGKPEEPHRMTEERQPSGVEQQSVNAAEVVSNLGEDGLGQLEAGQRIRDGIDPLWLNAARDRREAQVVVLAMLISRDSHLREEQVSGLRKGMGSEYSERVCEWQQAMEPLHSAEKIALLDLCIPTLRRLSRAEYDRLASTLDWVAGADGKIDLFEFMLNHVLTRHLYGHFGQVSRAGVAPVERMGDLFRAGNVLLSVMASLERDGENAKRAFNSAVTGCDPHGSWEPRLLPDEELDPRMLTAALAEFEEAPPIAKKTILQMCCLAAAEDGILTNSETELLRAIADAIGSGIPPFVWNTQLGES